jgi:FeS assembly SUF system protein
MSPDNEARPLNVLPHSGKVEQLKTNLPARSASVATNAPVPSGDNPLLAKVIEAVKQVYDPEIPVNIYELGLIYKIEISDDNVVKIEMTLTAPACPVAGTLPGEVANKIKAIEGVSDAEVELVWEPAWSKSRMTEEALLELGLI